MENFRGSAIGSDPSHIFLHVSELDEESDYDIATPPFDRVVEPSSSQSPLNHHAEPMEVPLPNTSHTVSIGGTPTPDAPLEVVPVPLPPQQHYHSSSTAADYYSPPAAVGGARSSSSSLSAPQQQQPLSRGSSPSRLGNAKTTTAIVTAVREELQKLLAPPANRVSEGKKNGNGILSSTANNSSSCERDILRMLWECEDTRQYAALKLREDVATAVENALMRNYSLQPDVLIPNQEATGGYIHHPYRPTVSTSKTSSSRFPGLNDSSGHVALPPPAAGDSSIVSSQQQHRGLAIANADRSHHHLSQQHHHSKLEIKSDLALHSIVVALQSARKRDAALVTRLRREKRDAEATVVTVTAAAKELRERVLRLQQEWDLDDARADVLEKRVVDAEAAAAQYLSKMRQLEKELMLKEAANIVDVEEKAAAVEAGTKAAKVAENGHRLLAEAAVTKETLSLDVREKTALCHQLQNELTLCRKRIMELESEVATLACEKQALSSSLSRAQEAERIAEATKTTSMEGETSAKLAATMWRKRAEEAEARAVAATRRSECAEAMSKTNLEAEELYRHMMESKLTEIKKELSMSHSSSVHARRLESPTRRTATPLPYDPFGVGGYPTSDEEREQRRRTYGSGSHQCCQMAAFRLQCDVVSAEETAHRWQVAATEATERGRIAVHFMHLMSKESEKRVEALNSVWNRSQESLERVHRMDHLLLANTSSAQPTHPLSMLDQPVANWSMSTISNKSSFSEAKSRLLGSQLNSTKSSTAATSTRSQTKLNSLKATGSLKSSTPKSAAMTPKMKPATQVNLLMSPRAPPSLPLTHREAARKQLMAWMNP